MDPLQQVNRSGAVEGKNRGSLDGIKVLDLSRMLPGPYCSMVLADHGADVIAIENVRFQKDGLFFDSLYRNKRHLTLNLKLEAGRGIFYRLAREADVIIEGFRPGVVRRLAVDYETVSRMNPKIIYCSISGYGQDGPFQSRAGHDVNYLSTSGVLDLIGPASGPPVIPGVQIGDIAGGSMNAITGILLALYARTLTGKGQYIDISMTDGLLGYLSLPLQFGTEAGSFPQRSRALLSHRYGCYNVYQTADERYLAIGALEKRFWQKLCDILEMGEYVDMQYDETRREEIIARLRQLFLTKNASDWEQLLKDHDICWSRVLTLEEVLEHPLFHEREMVVTMNKEDGSSMRMFGIPVKLSQTPGSIRSLPDQFGGSSKKILAELGYSEEQIDAFKANGVI